VSSRIGQVLLPLLLWPLATGAGLPARRPTAEPVELARDGTRVDVRIGGRPFTTYYFDPSVAKPYLFPLRSALGTVVTRGFPMTSDIPGEDRDEPHQRAMYFAHGDINGFDFWGEAAFPKWSDHPVSTFGRTVFRTLDDIQGGADSGSLRATFDLVAPTGTIAEQVQTYRFGGDGQSRIIDCEVEIHATHGPITMGDTKEGMFAIRVVKALDSPPGRMVNAAGASGEKGIWGKRSDWVDYYGRVAGEDVGLAIFDHPHNLRAPTYWHARAYGLVAANPFGIKQFTGERRQDGTYTIPSGGSLTFRYRVLIHHGNPFQAGVAEAYRQFAAEQ
jgi:methane monooxygenase PmoA-like